MKNVDIALCYSTPPKPREYVLPSLLPGTVGSIVSPGGLGKSMLAIELAHCIAGGVDLLGLGPLNGGRVTYLSAEDGNDILHDRLHAIGGRLSQEQRAACADRIVIGDLTNQRSNLLEQQCLKRVEKFATGSRLLFLDTLRTFHDGDENDGRQMSGLISSIRHIAASTGCAIVFLHHTTKAMTVSGQGDMAQASRGSSVLADSIRWQSYLAGMTTNEAEAYGVNDGQRDDFVRFGISKQNYGARFDERWFHRSEGGVLLPATIKRVNKRKRNDPAI